MTNESKVSNKELYTKLIKFPNRLWLLNFLLIITFVTITSLMFTNIVLERPWGAMVIPIVLVGTVLVIYPKTEEWEYKPWQSQAEKREQTFYD